MPNPKPMVSKKALVSWGEGNHHVLTETFRELGRDQELIDFEGDGT